MSDYMADLDKVLGGVSGSVPKGIKVEKKGSNMDLDMTDFLTLMITELTNQGIDQSVDTSDMLNQMIQMQMVEALANMTDASIMSYAASLVGKEITVGKYDSEGNLQELVGVVQGTGTKNGEQVVFVNDEYYYMNEIMAVGRLPAKPEETEKPDEDDKTDGVEKPGEGDGTGDVEGPGEGDGTEDVEKPDGTDPVDPPENTEPPAADGAENEDYNGENGAPTDPEA